jgi:hypothetical protein
MRERTVHANSREQTAEREAERGKRGTESKSREPRLREQRKKRRKEKQESRSVQSSVEDAWGNTKLFQQ